MKTPVQHCIIAPYIHVANKLFTSSNSHGENVCNEVYHIMCPELENAGLFFQHKYDCPNRNNTFVHAHRFYRAVFRQDFENDMDGISRNFRIVPQSCRQFLGVGLYNATIIMTPHWLFVYETQEGLDNYLISLQSLIENCKRIHGDLMKDHVILLQSATARDSLPFGTSGGIDKNPSHSWRGIHNHRVEKYAHAMKEKLQHHVDGIIPVFEMSYARMWTTRTKDGTHLRTSAYRDIFRVQMAAVRSALKFRLGTDLPLMNATDPHARWFVDHDLER